MKKTLKRLVKMALGRKINKYSGHFGVVRSILKGLKELGVDHNYNPRNLKDVGEHMHVLADVSALKIAIQLKKKGVIKRLSAGPNIVISSAEYSNVIGAPEIDLYTVNSEWTKDAYISDNPRLEGKIDYWYAGVDELDWKVEKISLKKGLKFLFYLKRPEWKLVEECKKELRKIGIAFFDLIYGDYNQESLKAMLAQADFVVYFVEQESQGIALFEMWASDTPTIVWNPGYWQYKMKNYRASSAPYLSEKTGLFFRDIQEFRKCIDEITNGRQFSGRAWILENGTDRIACKRFLKTIGYNCSVQ